MNGSIYVSGSANSKLKGSEPIDSTYSSIQNTCPSTCELKSNGCYATTSFVGIINRRLERESGDLSALELARAEAKAIDNSYDGKSVPANRTLRIHVSGDSKTVKGTRIINAAVKRWKKRGGGEVYSYTHAWAKVHRKEWNNVSILASVSSVKEVRLARKQGYAPAIVVSEHPTDKVYTLPNSDIKWIPCPSQTRKVACVDCRLCMKADWLFETNRGIAFAAHGIKKNSLKRHLKIIT